MKVIPSQLSILFPRLHFLHNASCRTLRVGDDERGSHSTKGEMTKRKETRKIFFATGRNLNASKMLHVVNMLFQRRRCRLLWVEIAQRSQRFSHFFRGESIDRKQKKANFHPRNDSSLNLKLIKQMNLGDLVGDEHRGSGDWN